MIHPPFDGVETWIFDLDNTLYPPHERLFSQIEARISAYVQRELGVDEDEAHRLRRAYWHDHGTTLAGLMLNHGIDPEPFLEEVHDIDFSRLDPDPLLRKAIDRLPGRKIVYTNGARRYAGRALSALGLGGAFERTWSIEDAFYEPKPRASAFQRIFGKDGLDPRHAAFFEDDPRNLAVPAALGVIGVLVRPGAAPKRTAAEAPEPAGGPLPAPPETAAALAEEVAQAARRAPIRPPAEEVPDHVAFVARDLPRFLADLTDPAAPAPTRFGQEGLLEDQAS
ncbi:pyrimidine 5'-nucleotidase [Rhodovulum sp. DZ06]|uniref:pyrimidine 5'-nucleotidase n=1 Tax=Rhodovulum sp. DZ06 TaxID=3425126 RepID=UPI003D33FC40